MWEERKKNMIKKLIGLILVLSPFIFATVVMAREDGWKKTIIAWLVALLIIAVVFGGFWLLLDWF